MKELKKRYLEAKNKAMELMQAGRVSEYIAHLVTVQDLRLQLMNSAVRGNGWEWTTENTSYQSEPLQKTEGFFYAKNESE